MKNWIIKKLGGFTRRELELTKETLDSMAGSYEAHRILCDTDNGATMSRFYDGKAKAFETASRTVGDLLR